MYWPKNLIKKIKINVNLAAYTSLKIGGRADFFCEPKNLQELKSGLGFAKTNALEIYLLGSGSNLLVSDSGVQGLVIRLSAPGFSKLSTKGSYLEAGCGVKLSQLLLYARNKNLSGLEFLAGIPGTLGGALAGYAGAWNKSIGKLVEEVLVLDYNASLKHLSGKQLKFGYRKSNLTRCIILQAKLKLLPEKKDKISAEIKNYLLRRGVTGSIRLPNAGCVFKNPSKLTAGKLIDACKLKGKKIGGAVISATHANFILNYKKAKSKDVLSLMRLMQKRVQSKFKIVLTPEIKIWQ